MMHYPVIATDYDGTLATDGRVSESTWAAIAAFRQRHGHVLLVTGREFEDLQQVCPQLDRFDGVIAENGGLIYWPHTDTLELQGDPPPKALLDCLHQAGVDSIRVGRVIMATWQPHGAMVQQAIAELGLPYQVILNKKAVMVLPVGVDKASTLSRMLEQMQLSPRLTVGIGDAENDMALLQCCGLGVAVGNALPVLKNIADYVTTGDRGDGVQEVIHHLLQNAFSVSEARSVGDRDG
jgi:hydroxymethylpyrimidine pyrophosphatase-like HAD family hydrolase